VSWLLHCQRERETEGDEEDVAENGEAGVSGAGFRRSPKGERRLMRIKEGMGMGIFFIFFFLLG